MGKWAKRCRNCEWWKIDRDDKQRGKCRGGTPTALNWRWREGVFPWVWQNEYCKEFDLHPDKAKEGGK